MFTQPKKKTVRSIAGLIVVLILILPASVAGQVIADFTASDTMGCSPGFLVQFTNTGSSGAQFSYQWTFGPWGQSTLKDPQFTFNVPGDILVTLTTTNNSTSETAVISKFIHVFLTPSANLTIDLSNACVNGNVEFRAGFSTKDSVLWDFGDGVTSRVNTSYMFHSYNAHGNYDVRYITYYWECSDTSDYIVTIDGPVADFIISPAQACKGAPITFTLKDTVDVTSFYWEPEEGVIINNLDPATHVFDTIGYLPIFLTVSGASGSCTIQDTLHIYEVIADFRVSDTRCHNQLTSFTNTSLGNASNAWNFGNNINSVETNPEVVLASGVYHVTLVIRNNFDCTDTIEKDIIINSLPAITMMNDFTICPDDTPSLEASGGHTISWVPAEVFDNPNSYTPVLEFIENTSSYLATVTDTSTHCSDTASVLIYVQEGFIQDKISVFPTDTNVIIGRTVQITVFDTLNRILTFTWTPDERLSCNNCPNPVMQPLTTTTYTLVVSDTNQCFMSENFEVTIEVTEEYRIGLPKAFTPNNDQKNDIIKVDGWGIQELLEFRIFNRSGVEVFSTNDIDTGWDGTYKNKPQNVDTYTYLIRARMWNENITVVQGTFSLIR